jgi:hypothetical protein
MISDIILNICKAKPITIPPSLNIRTLISQLIVKQLGEF